MVPAEFLPLSSLSGGSFLARTPTWLPGYPQPQQVLVPAVEAQVTVFAHGADPLVATPVSVFPNPDGSGTPLTQPLTPDQDGLLPGYVAQPAALDAYVTGPDLVARMFVLGYDQVFTGVGSVNGMAGAVVLGVNDIAGAAKLGTDNTVGGPGGSPLSPLVVAPAVAGTSGQMVIVRSDGTIKWTDPPRIMAKAWGVDPSATASANAAAGQAAINAANGDAAVVFPAGTIKHSSPFTMPRNATALDVGGVGRGVTVFQPTAAAVRVFDFPHVADGDTYQNTSLHDFSIDGSQLSLPAGANQSLIGNLINGARSARANFANIECRRITVTGVPVATSSGFQYQVFAFGSTQGGTTVAAGSGGVDVATFGGAGTLNVVTTGGFPTSGPLMQLKVQTSAGFATLSYTGTAGGNSFTGVNLVSGSGTLLTGNLVMEAAQNTMIGFTWEDLTVLGANDGFVIIADRISGSTSVGTNHYLDEINWTRCYHDCGPTPVSGNKPGGGQIGGSAQGGTYRVHDCTFKNAGDTYEFDGMQALYVTDTTVEDCVNGIFANNFNTPLNPQSQTVIFERVHLRIVKMQPTSSFSNPGITLGPPSTSYTGFNTLGHAILRDCTFVSYAPNAPGSGMFINASGRYVSKITIEAATAAHEGMADISVGSLSAIYMAIAPLSSCQLTIRGLRFALSGTTTNASLALRPLFVGTWNTSVAAALILDIDDPQFSYNLSGVTAGTIQLITVALITGGTTTSTFRGIISRFKFLPSVGDSNGKGIVLPTAATYPINTTQGAGLVVRDGDFSNGRSGGFDVITGQDAAQLARIFYYNNRWGLHGPNGMHGVGPGRDASNGYFSSTAFTTAVGNQYLGGFSGTAYISAGAEVTSVDISRNAGTNYENLGTLPTTTIAAASNGAVLPQATINVASTAGFPAAGTILIAGSAVTYTGLTPTSFTGCSGGSGTLSTGEVVGVAIPQTIVTRIENSDFLKMTYTRTAPTVVIVPDK